MIDYLNINLDSNFRKQAVACIPANCVRGCATHPTCGGTDFKTEV